MMVRTLPGGPLEGVWNKTSLFSKVPGDGIVFINKEPNKVQEEGGVDFVLDKDIGGVVAKLKVLSEVNSSDNFLLLSFLSPERQSLLTVTKEDVRKWRT